MPDNHPYIEVVSAASVSRDVESYRVLLVLNVTTGKKLSGLDESLALRDQVITQLKSAGIRDEDIQEGGGHVTLSKWSSSKNATHELDVSSTEMSVLVQAMANVERLFVSTAPRLFSGIKRDFSFSDPAPHYADDPDATEKSLAAAVTSARRKASILAREAGLKLGDVISITEEPGSESSSDEPREYGSRHVPNPMMMMGFGGSEFPTVKYSPVAQRLGTAWTYFRVRFVVEKDASHQAET